MNCLRYSSGPLFLLATFLCACFSPASLTADDSGLESGLESGLDSVSGSDLAVVATIKPLHSLVAYVMQGVGEPSLLVKGNASPHTFTLKPSSARILQRAELVFWVGPELEPFLQRPFESLAARARHSALGAILKEHKTGNELGVEQEPLPEHKDVHSHAHGEGRDAHPWLNPDSALLMLDIILRELAALDPANAATYQANANKASNRIAALSQQIEQQLQSYSDVPYIVFHDAYGGFEKRFSMHGSKAFLFNPESGPGADRVAHMRSTIVEEGSVCLFVEPQFDSNMIDVISEGSAIRLGKLDPLGADLEDGPELYFQLLKNLADNLVSCLVAP